MPNIDNDKVTNLSIVSFFVNFSANVNINYEFREWSYAKIKISLSRKVLPKKGYIDIDVNFILIDRQFLKKQISNAIIRIMTTSIIVRELRTF